LEGAGVEQVAGGVAVVEGFVDVVDLALDWRRGVWLVVVVYINFADD
jgi:hypothetical protein